MNLSPAQRMEFAERIGRVIAINEQIEAFTRLHAPLAQKLLSKRRAYILAGRDPEGMSITLRAREWPRQHERGVARCVGFDIHWIS